MKFTIALITAFIGAAAADDCYVQAQQQFNTGAANPITLDIKRGDCPMNVDEANTDSCEDLKQEAPVVSSDGSKVNSVDAGLANTVDVVLLNDHLTDGWLDYGDTHIDFSDDACQYSQSSGFGANLNEQVCKFTC